MQSLLALTESLFRAHSVDVVTVQGRVKDVDSFRGKISRDDKDYTDPLQEITDLAGIRVVTYQLADIDTVSGLILGNFTIDEVNSVDKRRIIEADRFGYLSVHYIVELSPDRAKLPEYAPYADLKAEIQVRTVLQHAWAAIDHKLRYKTREEVPVELRRRLFRISALLETADSEFETLRCEMGAVREEYETHVAKADLNLPLDLDSLRAYAAVAAVPQQITKAATDANYVIMPHNDNAKRPEFAALLQFLSPFEIPSLTALDKRLAGVMDRVAQLLEAINRHWRDLVNLPTPDLRLVVTRDALIRIVFPLSLPPEEVMGYVKALTLGEKLKASTEKAYSELYANPQPVANNCVNRSGETGGI